MPALKHDFYDKLNSKKKTSRSHIIWSKNKRGQTIICAKFSTPSQNVKGGKNDQLIKVTKWTQRVTIYLLRYSSDSREPSSLVWTHTLWRLGKPLHNTLQTDIHSSHPTAIYNETFEINPYNSKTRSFTNRHVACSVLRFILEPANVRKEGPPFMHMAKSQRFFASLTCFDQFQHWTYALSTRPVTRGVQVFILQSVSAGACYLHWYYLLPKN